jgi:hypothetical protein
MNARHALKAAYAAAGCETKFRREFGNLNKDTVLYICLNIQAKNECRQEAGGGG